MYKIIVKNKKHWDSIIEDVKPNILGLGIDDYKGHYFFGKYTPESYPFILIRVNLKRGMILTMNNF